MENISKITTIGLLFSVFIMMSPPAYSATSGEEWESIKEALSAAEKAETIESALASIQDAKAIYTDVFKNAASEVDLESDQLIENAFSDSAIRLTSADMEQASLNRQVIDKTIYKIAFMKMESSIVDDDSSEFLYWFDVMEKKFKISENDFRVNKLVDEIKQNPSKLSDNGIIITEELLQIFKLKTIEEIEEAIAALDDNDLKSAKKFTYEGLYYYRTLHPSVEEKLGEDTAKELLHEMEEAVEITTSGASIHDMKEELEHIAAEVELIIREYEGGNLSEIGLALSGIKDRLNLVEEEYGEAVSDGKIIDQVEYDEASVFLSKATQIFNYNEQEFLALSDSDASSLKMNLNEMNEIIDNKGNPNEISILVGKSLNNIISLEEYAGGETAIDILLYFDEIERLLIEAKNEYHQGNSQRAFDLVSEAYLDNYEFVEEPLGEADHELMEKIETDMREDLRNMIKSDAPTTEVDAQIDMIISDIATAKKVVPEFGTIAVMVLAIAIISIIVVSAKSKISMVPRL